MEKYTSCSLDSLSFIYSLQFLNATLDTVVSKLSKEGGSKFQNVSKHYPIQSARDLLRKGVYSDYMSSWNRSHDQELPPISKFADSEVSCSWQTFGMCIMGDYHDLYLKTDGLLLTDVFEMFEVVSLGPHSFLHFPRSGLGGYVEDDHGQVSII